MFAFEEEFIQSFALLHTKGIGQMWSKKLIDAFGSTHAIYNQSAQDLKKIIQNRPKIIQQIIEKKHFDLAEKELAFMKENDISFALSTQEEFPNLLKNCPDSPLIIYYKGKPIWNTKHNISIVGTRKCTQYGKENTKQLVENLAQLNVNIISGLALGIDTQAHLTAIENKVTNFAILAHGLNTIYPKSNQKYLAKIIDNGAIVTEYSSQAAFRKENFIQRNRIIAGMSNRTIIVESKFGGGSMTTARMAFNYDRELFAIPGRITDEISQGCNFLIKNMQAQLILHPQEVFEWFGKEKKTKAQKELFVEITETEKPIVSLLQTEEKLQVDQMAFRLNTPTFALMPILLDLEFKEVIQCLPGKFFTLK